MEKEKVLLAITGGIAAYKSAELTRLLIQRGYNVQVIMTPAATKFVAPLTFQSLSGNPVYVGLFDENEERIKHIYLANQPSLIIIAPATANTISKINYGIADNLLTTVVMASSVPVLFVPSMNDRMYSNPTIQKNLQQLKSSGYLIMEPESGELACGVVGKGRMPSPEKILDYALNILKSKKDFKDKNVIVTAGPTREPLDPVRYFSNHSTGKMGFAIARAFEERGAKVCLVAGHTEIPFPDNVKVIQVSTALEMLEAVECRFKNAHILVKTAAVSDYRPVKCEAQKIKKDKDITVELKRNPDILKTLGLKKTGQFLVGFAAETENLLDNARLKLESKNLDLIVANNVLSDGSGFGTDTNKVTILFREGETIELPLMNKHDVAHRLLDIILKATKVRNNN